MNIEERVKQAIADRRISSCSLKMNSMGSSCYIRKDETITMSAGHANSGVCKSIGEAFDKALASLEE